MHRCNVLYAWKGYIIVFKKTHCRAEMEINITSVVNVGTKNKKQNLNRQS